jgi:ribosome biogenesis GTPase A
MGTQPQQEDNPVQSVELEVAFTNAINYLSKNTASVIVVANQNVGKSTFLNNLLGYKEMLNTSKDRETAAVWKIRYRRGKETKGKLVGAGS